MAEVAKLYTLSNGVTIPSVGFGTWQIQDGETAVHSTAEALRCGYRHIDTAAAYGNEESVGRAVRESGIPRGELFITSKLQNPMHGYENTVAAFEATMQRLGTDYLDLYLIHWPNPVKFRGNWQAANAGTWKAFEEFYRAGRIRSIGVSNFLPHHLDALSKTATIAPMVNQIRLCPGDTQDAVVAYCRKHGILPEAYSPLGSGGIFDVPELQMLSEKYGKSVSQIALRWSLEMGFLPLPKSTTPARIKENLELFDFELDEDDFELITNLKNCCGLAADPDKTNF